MPFIQVGYKQIHYADWKPSNGQQPLETFVWIHGLGSSQNYYTAMVPAFTSASIRCICLDTTGQGRSPYSGVEQSVQSLAADIVGAMDALSVPKAVIIGHSMCGFTVPEVAAAYPERVSAMVLLGPVYINSDAVPIFTQRITKVEAEGMQPMADTVPYAAVASTAASWQHAFIRELLLASQPEGYISLCRVINGVNQDPKKAPDYSKVKCPTYIIAGDEDKSAPVSGCEKLLEALGTEKGEKKMVVLEQTGHWMAIERPERCSQKIMGFYESVQ